MVKNDLMRVSKDCRPSLKQSLETLMLLTQPTIAILTDSCLAMPDVQEDEFRDMFYSLVSL